jgi:hypothetical protein
MQLRRRYYRVAVLGWVCWLLYNIINWLLGPRLWLWLQVLLGLRLRLRLRLHVLLGPRLWLWLRVLLGLRLRLRMRLQVPLGPWLSLFLLLRIARIDECSWSLQVMGCSVDQQPLHLVDFRHGCLHHHSYLLAYGVRNILPHCCSVCYQFLPHSKYDTLLRRRQLSWTRST